HTVKIKPAYLNYRVNAIESGGTLYIDAPADVTIYVTMKTIERFSISGSGSISSDSPIKSEDLELSIGGSGKIALTQLDVKKLSADVSGIGKMTLAGRAETTDINIPGSGKVDAEGLKTV